MTAGARAYGQSISSSRRQAARARHFDRRKRRKQMFGWARQLRAKSKGHRAKCVLMLISIMMCAGVGRAQETSGDLSGGAGIFRPRNPESKRRTNTARPVARPTRPNPAEIEARFEDQLSDGNDARDARKYADRKSVV